MATPFSEKHADTPHKTNTKRHLQKIAIEHPYTVIKNKFKSRTPINQHHSH